MFICKITPACFPTAGKKQSAYQNAPLKASQSLSQSPIPKMPTVLRQKQKTPAGFPAGVRIQNLSVPVLHVPNTAISFGVRVDREFDQILTILP